ncbi:MAG: hypothetical protein FJ029_04345 [Actinobacteria bacterium]|nr:hypothetical protein [Actinomycetota bacterium]
MPKQRQFLDERVLGGEHALQPRILQLVQLDGRRGLRGRRGCGWIPDGFEIDEPRHGALESQRRVRGEFLGRGAETGAT